MQFAQMAFGVANVKWRKMGQIWARGGRIIANIWTSGEWRTKCACFGFGALCRWCFCCGRFNALWLALMRSGCVFVWALDFVRLRMVCACVRCVPALLRLCRGCSVCSCAWCARSLADCRACRDWRVVWCSPCALCVFAPSRLCFLASARVSWLGGVLVWLSSPNANTSVFWVFRGFPVSP